jgi:hypothetical protein
VLFFSSSSQLGAGTQLYSVLQVMASLIAPASAPAPAPPVFISGSTFCELEFGTEVRPGMLRLASGLVKARTGLYQHLRAGNSSSHAASIVLGEIAERKKAAAFRVSLPAQARTRPHSVTVAGILLQFKVCASKLKLARLSLPLWCTCVLCGVGRAWC